ncbi:hypothetical protein QT231_19395, partial [Halomonas sp. SpR1]|uniref:hypothetical protein n=1 Tax=Halomonas sp. SpR1 TaxID=3050462 RepID=UPI0027E3CB4B
RRLALPLAGRAGDFHPQVILRHHPQEQRQSRRCAPCLAHYKKEAPALPWPGLYQSFLDLSSQTSCLCFHERKLS